MQHNHETIDMLGQRAKRYYLEHVCHMPDEGSYVLATMDVTDALNQAFVIAADQYTSRLCKGPITASGIFLRWLPLCGEVQPTAKAGRT